MTKSVRRYGLFVLVVSVAAFALSGCSRGYLSEKAPVHPNPNMDWQPKYKAQTMPIEPPVGTVAWGVGDTTASAHDRSGIIEQNPVRYKGKTYDGQWVRRIPVKLTRNMVKRGQERYDIYCAVCHDRAGTGKGMVVKRGFVPAPDFADARVVNYTDGELFHIISNGIRTMPAYSKQIPTLDRWAIVSYIRVLQKMRSARYYELPAELKAQLK